MARLVRVVIEPFSNVDRKYHFSEELCEGNGGMFTRWLSVSDSDRALRLGDKAYSFLKRLVGLGPRTNHVPGIKSVTIRPLELTVTRSPAGPAWVEIDEMIFQLLESSDHYGWKLDVYTRMMIHLKNGVVEWVDDPNYRLPLREFNFPIKK